MYRFLILACALLFCARAQAQTLDQEERLLAFDLARVAMNEAGTEADLALIWQVVEAHGATTRARHAWLRAHSPCATGVLAEERANARPGNCRWVRNLALLRNQHSAPQGFEPAHLWPRTRERFVELLRLARDLVGGERRLIVCAEVPTTWDGGRWQDEAVERGFRPVECKGTRNVGYVRDVASRVEPE